MVKEIDIAKVMSQAAGNSAADLIASHWNSIESAIPDSGKITVSIQLKLKRSGTAYKQTFKLSYGSKTTDEREDTIETKQLKMEGVE